MEMLAWIWDAVVFVGVALTVLFAGLCVVTQFLSPQDEERLQQGLPGRVFARLLAAALVGGSLAVAYVVVYAPPSEPTCEDYDKQGRYSTC